MAKFETREALSAEISDLMDRLNRAVIAALDLGESKAVNEISAAWTAAYDARAILDKGN